MIPRGNCFSTLLMSSYLSNWYHKLVVDVSRSEVCIPCVQCFCHFVGLRFVSHV